MPRPARSSSATRACDRCRGGQTLRRYLPIDALVELATYVVRATTELEDLDLKEAEVYALRPSGSADHT